MIWDVLGKSLIFAILLIAFHSVEEVIRAWLESEPLSTAFVDFGGTLPGGLTEPAQAVGPRAWDKRLASGFRHFERVSVNTPTLPRWQLVQMATVTIACPTGVYALLFSRVSGCQGTRDGIARVEPPSIQKQRH